MSGAIFRYQINMCVLESSLSLFIGETALLRFGISVLASFLNNVIMSREKVIHRDRSPKPFQSTKVLQVRGVYQKYFC